MSKTRKILSIVLAIVMVFGVFSVCAFAADVSYESETDAKNYTQTWALTDPVKNANGSWSVDVKLTTNYDTGAIQFVVENADGNATLDKVELNTANIYYAAEVSKTSKGLIMITPKTGGNNAGKKGASINGVIATLTYSVTAGKQATIAIKNDAKSATNVGGSLIAARLSGKTGETKLDSSTMVVGQTATVGESKVLGDAANPELKVIAGTNGVIDTTRTTLTAEDESTYKVDGLLYGVETSKDVDDGTDNVNQTITDVFKVENGTMNIVANDVNSKCGTGTKVQVLDNSGKVVATYVLVIFGDINGDGRINNIDSNAATINNIGYYDDGDDGDGEITDTVKLLAADVNGDGRVNNIDSNLMTMHNVGYYPDGDDGDGVMSQYEIMTILSQKEII